MRGLRRIAPLLLLFAFEFFVFDRYGARRFTNFYPRWNDQVQYLAEGYAGYEYARAHGLPAGLWHALANPSQQGALHDFFAVIAFSVAGPSRAAALALNLLALLAWQATLFVAVSRRARSGALALAVALLPLLLAGLWQNIPGSAYDFRLDHLALCALGVSATLAWLSEGFRARRTSTLFGLAVGITVLTRFLTGVYFALIFLALLGWLLGGTDRRARVGHLLRAAVIALVMALPVLAMNWDAVRDYYWIGHYVGPESAIRNPHLGLGRSLAFVSENLVQRHLGFLVLGAGALGAIALRFGHKERTGPTGSDGWVIGATFLLAPALALILHPQKSEVVVGALVPGFITLLAATWCHLAAGAERRTLRIVAAGTLAVTLPVFVHAQVPPIYSPADQVQLRLVNAITDEIFQRLQSAGKKDLRVAVDYVTDAFDAQVLRVMIYERHHVWLEPDMRLPTSIAEPSDEVVMTRLGESDFVFLTEEGPAPRFPFDRKLETMRPQVHAWCEAHLRGVNRFTFFGRRMVLYQRREIPFP